MDRFIEKVVVWADGCWTWSGAKSLSGYGKFWFGTRLGEAHRFAYEQWRGSIPHGLHIDHLCQVKTCVNPSHLEAVSARENLLRSNGMSARNAHKTHCKFGHPFDEANTAVNRFGHRRCRACTRRANAEYIATRTVSL